MVTLTEEDKIVVIVGLAASGKTKLADELSKVYDQYAIYHTDDYINNFNDLLWHVINDKAEYKIIEGCQGYNLLRKGLVGKFFYSNVVINVVAKTEIRIQRALMRGTSVNLKQMDKTLMAIWFDYLSMPKNVQPKIIDYQT